jgi:hypothetical protein
MEVGGSGVAVGGGAVAVGATGVAVAVASGASVASSTADCATVCPPPLHADTTKIITIIRAIHRLGIEILLLVHLTILARHSQDRTFPSPAR